MDIMNPNPKGIATGNRAYADFVTDFLYTCNPFGWAVRNTPTSSKIFVPFVPLGTKYGSVGKSVEEYV